jgi:hypothetical protein
VQLWEGTSNVRQTIAKDSYTLQSQSGIVAWTFSVLSSSHCTFLGYLYKSDHRGSFVVDIISGSRSPDHEKLSGGRGRSRTK